MRAWMQTSSLTHAHRQTHGKPQRRHKRLALNRNHQGNSPPPRRRPVPKSRQHVGCDTDRKRDSRPTRAHRAHLHRRVACRACVPRRRTTTGTRHECPKHAPETPVKHRLRAIPPPTALISRHPPPIASAPRPSASATGFPNPDATDPHGCLGIAPNALVLSPRPPNDNGQRGDRMPARRRPFQINNACTPTGPALHHPIQQQQRALPTAPPDP